MSRERGFTLLEVLVALTLMSLLVVALFGGFRAGLRAWQSMEEHVERTEDPRQLSSLIYRHLTQMTPVMLRDDNFRPTPAFLGEKGRLRYVAPLAMSVGDVPYLVEIVDGYNGKSGIWIRFAPVRAGARIGEVFTGASYQQVSKKLSIAFSYFHEGEWKDSLPAGGKPDLVSIRLNAVEVNWPNMVIAVTRVEAGR